MRRIRNVVIAKEIGVKGLSRMLNEATKQTCASYYKILKVKRHEVPYF